MNLLREKVSHELRFIDEPDLAQWIFLVSFSTFADYVERANSYMEDRYKELLVSQPDLPNVIPLCDYVSANRAIVIRNLIFADEYPELAHKRYREY